MKNSTETKTFAIRNITNPTMPRTESGIATERKGYEKFIGKTFGGTVLYGSGMRTWNTAKAAAKFLTEKSNAKYYQAVEIIGHFDRSIHYAAI